MALTPVGKALAPLVGRFLDDALAIMSCGEAYDPADFDRDIKISCSEYVQIKVAQVLVDIKKIAPGVRIDLPSRRGHR